MGAPLEASSATGLNGNQADNTTTDAGAVYRFVRSGTTWSQAAPVGRRSPARAARRRIRLVVTHGDFTFANIFVNPTGLLDLGRLGVADRYQDISLVLRDIEGNYGTEWREPFVMAYGLKAIDDSKLSFFRLLDELF